MYNQTNCKQKPLIVVDAGHGGWDNGAMSQDGERLEKDDNLKLALLVQKELECQGVPVLMTRDTDVFVSLQDRAQIANDAKADLFISLHRNSYPTHTPNTNGVQNYIYLVTPEATQRAAQLVLDQVADVGVQSNWGVLRGDYYVLRRTAMSAMLLEMGFIIDPVDNMLFDEHIYEYAAAIAKGAMEHFCLKYREKPCCPGKSMGTAISG
ncbi:MAG: N-acetylmuramoyl-L-alanine amidase [Oscillospiraceae bacterium]|nr:N-acetylmuramoyl-L-alanine amidase [Oscillospiraceae bacterium]